MKATDDVDELRVIVAILSFSSCSSSCSGNGCEEPSLRHKDTVAAHFKQCLFNCENVNTSSFFGHPVIPMDCYQGCLLAQNEAFSDTKSAVCFALLYHLSISGEFNRYQGTW